MKNKENVLIVDDDKVNHFINQRLIITNFRSQTTDVLQKIRENN